MSSQQQVVFDLGAAGLRVRLPASADLLTMGVAAPVADPSAAIEAALAQPIGTPALDRIVRDKLAADPAVTAVVVISDNTRPVPYRGPSGILWPVVRTMLAEGLPPERITVLVATGTHRPVTEGELAEMLDPRVLAAGVRVVNHDCRDEGSLHYVGTTPRGTRIAINHLYLRAGIRVLTGLVESHFMAGASGGRKAVVPGLMGEQGTYVFHGAEILSSPDARDLLLDGNPCHEESLAGARLAPPDLIVNVTLDRQFNLTGVFAGELDQAHRVAFDHLKSYAGIQLHEPYDVVLTHAGRVGINHYQAAKGALAGAAAVRPGGWLVLAANHSDVDPVGSARYRTTLHLLRMLGPEGYERLLAAREWQFVPDQWQPQMWAKALRRVPAAQLYYCALGLAERDYDVIPGRNAWGLSGPASPCAGGESAGADRRNLEDLARVTAAAVDQALREARASGISQPRLACLLDGPYGIPLVGGE